MFQDAFFKFLGIALLGLLLASTSRAGETAVEIPDGVSILENWDKDQHVYRVGELGVRPELLDGLERWLDENASNWTVLFLESALGESYTDVFGETSRGIDAVEDAMEKGLPARTAFSEFKDPDSGRPTGAFFILSLKERTMSYYGSESYQFGGVILLEKKVKEWREKIADFQTDLSKLERLESEIPNSLGAALQKANAEYRDGDPAYLNSMRDLKILIANSRASQERQDSRQKMLATGGATGAGFLALMGVVGNRRRRRVKAQAEELLGIRRAEMKGMSDRLFMTMDRAAVVVGPAEELAERGYAGKTLDLSKQALQKIDEAFVLSSNVQRIVAKAESLMVPGNPLGKSRNLVSGGNYEDAIDLLDAEMRAEAKAVPDLQERSRPGEDREEIFAMPLDEWAGQTGDALNDAEKCLDEVDLAWTTIVSRRENLDTAILALSDRRPEPTDGWFECDAVFESWLPEIRGIFEKGAELGRTDPVGALQGAFGTGDRMVEDAGELLAFVERFREDNWAGLAAGEKTLHEHHRGTAWIDEALENLSASCDAIAERGVSESVADRISEFGRDLNSLSGRVANGADLVKRADDLVAPSIRNSERLVTKNRGELATALKLKDEDLLVEEGANPSQFLTEADRQLGGALAALDRGEITPAQGFLDEVDALVAKSKSLVEDSRKSLVEYPAMSEALRVQRGELEESLAETGKDVEEMRLRYAPRALFVNPENAGAGSYADSPARIAEVLAEIARRLEGAKSTRERGALLESRNFLETGHGMASSGNELCREARARKDELETLEKSNAEQFGNRSREEKDLGKQVEDRRVTRATLVNFRELGQRLKEARNEVAIAGGRNDPYRSELLLEELAVRIPALRSAIVDDLSQHGDAERLFGTVTLALREARELYRTAESDRIPDSLQTTQAYRDVEGLEHDLDEALIVLETDHADWRSLQARLRRLHLGLSEAAVAFRRELKLAREAVRYLEAGAHEVDRAESWSGAYGVRINGRPGGRVLDQANVVMMQGNYQAAMEWAGRALADARAAVASAEAQQSARAHAERRRRESRQRSARSSRMTQSMMSSSSPGTRSSPSHGNSRSSSVGRSSFRSGSNVGRSGW